MNIKFKKTIIKTQYILFQNIQIIVGTVIIALATNLFLLPNQLSVGGFAGIGTIIYYLFEISIGTTLIILNIPLFIIALLKSGRKFFISAIVGTATLSIFLNLFQNIKPLTNDRFLACIYGGIMSGIGMAIIMKADSSTGGTELLSNIIKAYKPHIKTSTLIVWLDIIVVSLNVVFFKRIEVGLYSAIAIFLMGKILDVFFEGIDFTKMILIISSKHEEISEKISKEIKRGTTALYGRGMYKKEDKSILLCVASRGEVREIRRIINEVDSKAFVIITNAREVFGEGFKK